LTAIVGSTPSAEGRVQGASSVFGSSCWVTVSIWAGAVASGSVFARMGLEPLTEARRPRLVLERVVEPSGRSFRREPHRHFGLFCGNLRADIYSVITGSIPDTLSYLLPTILAAPRACNLCRLAITSCGVTPIVDTRGFRVLQTDDLQNRTSESQSHEVPVH
jgi:hypothetical protein